jgi:hypothetical protein
MQSLFSSKVIPVIYVTFPGFVRGHSSAFYCQLNIFVDMAAEFKQMT